VCNSVWGLGRLSSKLEFVAEVLPVNSYAKPKLHPFADFIDKFRQHEVGCRIVQTACATL
jgi:hypothetical protein